MVKDSISSKKEGEMLRRWLKTVYQVKSSAQ